MNERNFHYGRNRMLSQTDTTQSTKICKNTTHGTKKKYYLRKLLTLCCLFIQKSTLNSIFTKSIINLSLLISFSESLMALTHCTVIHYIKVHFDIWFMADVFRYLMQLDV